MKKNCKYCQESFKPLRRDMEYCSVSCRNKAYYDRKVKDDPDYSKKVNLRLKERIRAEQESKDLRIKLDQEKKQKEIETRLNNERLEKEQENRERTLERERLIKLKEQREKEKQAKKDREIESMKKIFTGIKDLFS